MKDIKLLVSLISSLIVASCFITSVRSAEQSIKENVLSVTEGKTVKVHYTLTVEGKIIDSSKERKPLEFQIGSRQVIPGFEKAIKGMKVGEKKSFQVSPDEGYGEENPKAIQEVSRDKLPLDIKPEPGMTLYARGKNGYPIPLRIIEVKKDVVVLNFNHPLAGKILNFEVEIVDISQDSEPDL